MPLPRITNDSRYRSEEVDLEPGGSTIVVESPADNPFELADDIEVVTQASGGMAGPDPRQRSKRVVHGRQRATQGRVDHLNRGFMPGMGDDGDEVEVGLFGPVRKDQANARRAHIAKVHKAKPVRHYTAGARGFMPGMGVDLDDQMDGFGADPAAPAQPSFFDQAAGATAKILGAQATLEAAKAQRDGARRSGGPLNVTYATTTTTAAPRESSMGKTVVIIGAIAAAAALGYILFKKKG